MQCRACRTFNCNKAMDMKYIIPRDGKTLYDYFNACTQLRATNDDDLPKFLCIKCTQSLQRAYNFRKEAHASDKELKRILLESPKTELASLTYDSPGQLKFGQVISSDANRVCKTEESTFVSYQKPKQRLILPTKNRELLENLDPLSISEPTKKQCVSEKSTPLSGLQISIVEQVMKSESLVDIPDESIEIRLEDDLNTKKPSDKNEEKKFDGENCIPPLSRIRRCDRCDYKCGTKHVLQTHIFEKHSEEIVCRQCSKAFDWPREMELHEKLVHNTDENICCPWCKQSKAMPLKYLSKHIQKKHKNNYYKYYPRVRMAGRGVEDPLQCELCNKFFRSASELVAHTQDHTFECSECGMAFHKSEAYRVHLRSKHDLKPLLGEVSIEMAEKCALCSKYFNTKQMLRLHIKRIHNQADIDDTQNNSIISKDHSEVNLTEASREDEAMEISVIPYSQNTKKGTPRIVRGRENENDDGLVECKYCHKSIPTSEIISHEKRHYYISRREGKHICAYCSREFKRPSAVKLHERNIHLSDESIKKECPICHKQLAPKYLKDHMANVHTAEKKYVCDLCGNRFKNKRVLYIHKQLHFDRKFPCTLCTKKFLFASELKVHMRCHTGEEPYTCHLCDRRFVVKGRLTYHLEKHNNVMYKCKVCSKEYASACSLRCHSYVHTGGKPYRCPDCDYEFVKRRDFITHLLRKHDKVMTDLELSEMFKANTGRYSRVVVFKETDI